MDNPLRRPVRALFLSDLHLGARDCQAAPLIALLRSVRAEAIVLVGDVVDLWSLRRAFHWPAAHGEVLRLLLAHARRGTRVTYVPGNHDAELREFIGDAFGPIEVHRDYVHRTARGERMLVLHGDEFDGMLRCAPWMASLGAKIYDASLGLNRHLNALRRRFGYSHWSLAAHLRDHVPQARAYVAAFERAAVHEARRRGLDGVICGHIHRPRIARLDGLLYCNDGDWVENCTALVEDLHGRLALWHGGAALVAPESGTAVVAAARSAA